MDRRRCVSMTLAVHDIIPEAHYSCAGETAICSRGLGDQNNQTVSRFKGRAEAARVTGRMPESYLYAGQPARRPSCAGRLCRRTPVCGGTVSLAGMYIVYVGRSPGIFHLKARRR